MRETNKVGEDLKAVAEDVMQLGARCVQAGRAWLTDRRNEMIDRDEEHRSYQDAPVRGERQGWRASPQHQDRQPGFPQSGYQQPGYQHGEYQQPHSQQGYQQGYQGGRQYGQRPPQRTSDEYASRDYGRSHEQSWRETSQGEGPYAQGRYNQGRQQGYPGASREEQRQESQFGYGGGGGGYQGGYQGSRGQRQSHDYAGYGARQQGEGYGDSSGYGNPDDDHYGYSGGGGQSFISPADTQQQHNTRGGGYGRGRYGGVGPRNYTRSDARISEDLCERLTMDHDVDASDIEVKVSQGSVTLEGTVAERWMKHRAEDLADHCSGVKNVENRIRVQSGSRMGGESSGSGGESGYSAGGTSASTASARPSGGTETGSPSTPTSSKSGDSKH